jgi:asparagine synthase (glutamine-hydrolysing)
MQADFNHSKNELESFNKHYIDRPYEEYQQTIHPIYQQNNTTKIWINKQLNKPYADDFLNKVLRMDITRLIVDDPIKRVDNMTMAWGLEARVPFMDTALIEHALSIPVHIKLKNYGKHPLKSIAKKSLPAEIINRKKGYFPMPALKYIKEDFHHFIADILNGQKCINRGIFQRDYIQRLISI